MELKQKEYKFKEGDVIVVRNTSLFKKQRFSNGELNPQTIEKIDGRYSMCYNTRDFCYAERDIEYYIFKPKYSLW